MKKSNNQWTKQTYESNKQVIYSLFLELVIVSTCNKNILYYLINNILINKFISQRELNSVQTLLIDIIPSSDWDCLLVKAGALCKGTLIVSLPSQTITELIVGLFDAFSWTHNKPIWINLMISLLGFSTKKGSIMISGLPSTHLFHA